jgi:hypothetical protein
LLETASRDQIYRCIHLTLRLFRRNTTTRTRTWWKTYPKTPLKNGCVIIEGARNVNKMAGKGQIISERASS